MSGCPHKNCIPEVRKLINFDYDKKSNIDSYTTLETNALPHDLYDDIINRRYNSLIKKIQNDSKWYTSVYLFDMKLRQAYELSGRNRMGCCHKLLWKPKGGDRVLSFNHMVNLNRFRVKLHRQSHLHWFINAVLTSYKKMQKAKMFVAGNKYYPYHNAIKEKSYTVDNKGKTVDKTINSNCLCFNRMNYINWLKSKNINI